MIPTPTSDDNQDPRRSESELLTVRTLLLLIIAGGIGVLWIHDPRWGAAALAAITVLACLAAMIKLPGSAWRGPLPVPCGALTHKPPISARGRAPQFAEQFCQRGVPGHQAEPGTPPGYGASAGAGHQVAECRPEEQKR